MRICMLTTFYPPWSFGGDAIQVERLTRALADRGHDVTVVHSREAYRLLARRGADAPVEYPGVRVVGVDAGVGPVSPLVTYLTGRPLLVRRALERALAEGFDILHFHNPSLLGGPASLALGDAIKLYTLHEQWLVCPTHVLWKYGRRVCERPQCVRCTLSYRRPPQPWRATGLLERSLEGIDALIAPTASSAALHARFRRQVRIEQLGHFLAEPPALYHDSSTAIGAQPRRPYFLYAGRLESVKGIDRLVAHLRGRPDIELTIAGTGSLEPQLRRATRDLDNVRMLGHVEQERLDALYRGALAVIVPSAGHESFPLVLLEAFARRRPAIVHRFAALAELADVSGAALTYANAGELDEALTRLRDDAQLRETLGSRARSAYERYWTPEVHLRGYFQIIERSAERRADRAVAAAARAAAEAA